MSSEPAAGAEDASSIPSSTDLAQMIAVLEHAGYRPIGAGDSEHQPKTYLLTKRPNSEFRDPGSLNMISYHWEITLPGAYGECWSTELRFSGDGSLVGHGGWEGI